GGALAGVGPRQRVEGLQGRLLEDVLRLDLAPQGRPELPLDVRQQGAAAALDELGQGRRVALAQPADEVAVWVGHRPPPNRPWPAGVRAGSFALAAGAPPPS